MLALGSSYISILNSLLKLSPQKLQISFLLLVGLLLLGCQSEPNEFLQALQGGNDSVAFALLDADLQKEMGGKDGFEEWADTWRPSSWSFGSKCSADFNVAKATASGELASGDRFIINIHQRNVDGSWMIQGIEYTTYQTESWGISSGLDCLD